MTETYSVAQKGQRADSVPAVQNVTLPDSSARVGGMANAAQMGTQMLCKNPDGSQSWYTLDAERSTPDKPVLRPV
ncbi:MAG TPA: hypothetical protein VIV09_02990 [Pseudolabrys sp.]